MNVTVDLFKYWLYCPILWWLYYFFLPPVIWQIVCFIKAKVVHFLIFFTGIYRLFLILQGYKSYLKVTNENLMISNFFFLKPKLKKPEFRL